MVGLLGLQSGKAIGTTATTSRTQKEDGASHLDYGNRRLYHRIVGKLLWRVWMRPDLSYNSNELSRTLQLPPFDDLTTHRFREGGPNQLFASCGRAVEH